jgi:DNA polymerase-3 subunit delta'
VLHPLVGHAVARAALAGSVAAGQVPGSLLFYGPPGIGKQRLGLWYGQLLLCAAPGAEPCGGCRPCRLAVRIEHPDLHWFFPLPRPRVSGGADRLGEALEEARAAELASRRADPLRATGGTELVGLYLAHVQLLRRVAQARPAMAGRKVFVLGDAEALVPQEASPEAANALLKVLEEPPGDTVFIVTAADPDALLPTIRSRLLPVRLRPLPAGEVEAFLVERRALERAEAARVARLAQGSIGRALGFLPVNGEPGQHEATRQAARLLLEAALDGGATARFTAALAQAPSGARAGLVPVLASLDLWIRDLAATATGAEDAVINQDSLPWLREQARRRPTAAAGAAAALRAVATTDALTQLNVNPQLAVASLLRRLAAALDRAV